MIAVVRMTTMRGRECDQFVCEYLQPSLSVVSARLIDRSDERNLQHQFDKSKESECLNVEQCGWRIFQERKAMQGE